MKNDKISLHWIPDPHASPVGTTAVWGEALTVSAGATTQPYTAKGISWYIYGPAQCIYMNP